ncbi:AN1-type zinc finger protein 4 isoform B [Alligator mississippiensis]|uniref:AN1-type zinc finger protein 4 isoform B n=1 Tax=Alligator mississippiensis TaxID=8496 RepID=A0A151MKU2_ALLMI|nr:AN1-type zinc finger protein 4 isoform B [Alligator mississippiensis]
MANKKDPPFFNEDNVGPFHYKLPFYETMELFIETLTGTWFELRVSPFETVISVKAKIQRLEGIPVSQQHLIWNNVELEDDYCLNDYNISDGCTLKLVLAMRGGPINTRRVPVEDPIREMAEYMDPSRDEVWEKGPSNKPVTFLVYREGDQLNFFRVVDRGDGTLTPLSESLSGSSVYNLYADDDDETEASPSGQQIIENSITMNKMKLLKAKMENMNLSKKPKKTVKVKPRPPMTPRPSSGSVASARHRTTRFRSVEVDSPGKRPDVISKMEARDIIEVVNKTSKEPVGSVSNLGFLTLLSRSTSRESLQNSCGTGRFRTSGIALPTNVQRFQEESFRKTSPPNEAAEYFLSAHGLGMNGNVATVGKRVGETTHLPPVTGLIQTKKKTAKHCFFCGKKTGLASSYECRCGNNFCATHRYAETHTCTYDYKSAGRRFLQETNPVVSAPKLPKI